MDPDKEVQQEFLPFLYIYKSGRIERLLGTQVVAAGFDPASGVASKDVVIDPDTGLAARLYLPDLSTEHPSDSKGKEEKKKLPIIVYCHGGGFVIETASSPTYHGYLNSLVSNAKVVAVSVNYRRAPEHPIPAAYDDSWQALNWVAAGGAGEPWLAEHGDFGRIFLAGDSAGANIVHDVALRAGRSEFPNGVRVEGIALIHPYFWGATAIGEEKQISPEMRALAADMWTFACPDTPGLDDPRLNPIAAGAPSLKGLACRRVLVAVALKDYLRERGRKYYDALKGSGWEGVVELLESEGEEHVFHLQRPGCANAVAKMRALVAFFNSD